MDWERKQRTSSKEKHVSYRWKDVLEGNWLRLEGYPVGFVCGKASVSLISSEVSHV